MIYQHNIWSSGNELELHMQCECERDEIISRKPPHVLNNTSTGRYVTTFTFMRIMLILRSPCHRNMSRYYLTLKAKTINQ